MAIYKKLTELTSLEAWERLAGPKSAGQWVDGRSAKEVARAWLEGNGTNLPPEVASVLAGHPAFGEVCTWQAEPEAKLRFDKFAGEPRNSDLVVHAQDAHGHFLLAVEAKADEPFSETVTEALAKALERKLENDRSNGVARIQQLAKALLGPRMPLDPPVGDIRYQLLTACAGALCEAERQGYSRTVLLVHEFVSDKADDDKRRRNANDLNLFTQRLSHGAITSVAVGKICGPFGVPGAPLLETKGQLYIGKVSRNLRPNGA